MKSTLFYCISFICSVLVIFLSVYINIFVGLFFLFAVVTVCSIYKNLQGTIEQLILMAIFLAPCSNIFVFKTGYIDLKILQFLWLTIFILILILYAVRKKENFCQQQDITTKVIFTAYLVGIGLSCLFSINITQSVKELFQYIFLLIMMYVLYSYSKNRLFLYKIVTVMIASNIFVVIVCLGSYFTGKMLIPSYNMYPDGSIEVIDSVYFSQSLVGSSETINRINSIMGLGTIALANCVLIQSLFVNYMLRQATGKFKLMYIALFCANAVTVAITYSRAALFLFFIINFVTLISKDRKRNLMLILLGIVAVCTIFIMVPTLFQRLMETFNLKEDSTKYHLVYWLIALKEGYDNFATGIGIGNAAFHHDKYSYLFTQFNLYKTNGVDIHNFILQVWAEQGIIGLSANLLLVLAPIVNYIKNKFIYKIVKGKNLYDFVIMAYLVTLCYNMTNNNYYVEIFWTLAAMVYTCQFILVEKSESSLYKTTGMADRSLEYEGAGCKQVSV